MAALPPAILRAPDVAASHARDRRQRLGVGGLLRGEGQAQLGPRVSQYEAQLLRAERPVVVDEADPGEELRVAGQPASPRRGRGRRPSHKRPWLLKKSRDSGSQTLDVGHCLISDEHRAQLSVSRRAVGAMGPPARLFSTGWTLCETGRDEPGSAEVCGGLAGAELVAESASHSVPCPPGFGTIRSWSAGMPGSPRGHAARPAMGGPPHAGTGGPRSARGSTGVSGVSGTRGAAPT
jgi:hypothetical protein